MLGNSSSGIMETPALGLPTVNVGRRQQGRERAANIIDVPARATVIKNAVEAALAPAYRRSLQDTGVVNPYGDGHAGERIAALLADAPPTEALLLKKAPEVA